VANWRKRVTALKDLVLLCGCRFAGRITGERFLKTPLRGYVPAPIYQTLCGRSSEGIVSISHRETSELELVVVYDCTFCYTDDRAGVLCR